MTSTLARKTTTLRRLLDRPEIVRTVGAGDAMSAMLGERHGFEAIWASGLAISVAHGVPDASILTMTEFLDAARIIDHSTRVPVVADCDTGFGDVNVVMRMVAQYERAGIAGVCIEDKVFPKRNSFSSGQKLANVGEFSRKVFAAKRAQLDPDFVVIARTESLITGAGLSEAIDRGLAYQDAGADAVLIHSKSTHPDEVLEFATTWPGAGGRVPLVAVPTTYYDVTAGQLMSAGISMVIYANQSLRAAMNAIDTALQRLYAADSTSPIEGDLAPIDEVLALIGMGEVDGMERALAQELASRGASSAPAPSYAPQP